MEKERYKVRVSDDLCFVGVFDLQENKYVVNESVICLDTAHLLCDLFNKVDQQDARIKELEEIRDSGNQKLENFYNEKIDKLDNDYNQYFDNLEKENQQLKQQLEEKDKVIEMLNSIKRYDIGKILIENTKLKQSQNEKANEKAIEVLKKVKNYFITTDDWLVDGCELLDFVNNLIKDLEGEKD